MKSDKASSRKIQWGGLPFHSLSWDLQQRFGKKLYKLSLDGGMTCPNRDGTLGRGGCIFCSAGGSGDFAAPRQEDLNLQIQEAKAQIAGKAKECGVELFVLDDGWFGQRNTEHAGLGDWTANTDKLPSGIAGLSEKIEKMGMMFGL